MVGHVGVGQRVWSQDDVGGIPASYSHLEEESEDGECGECDNTSDDTCQEPIRF
jgi:hypothetical protein